MGVVSKQAIDKHLGKKFKDHTKLKKVSFDKLMGLIQSYTKGRPYLFKTVPMLHQLVGILLILSQKKFLLFFDMGLGKSKTLLDAASILIKIGRLHKILVVVENEVSVDEFCEQASEHSWLTCTPLSGTRDRRWKTFEDNYETSDMFVIQYAGLQSMLTKPKKGSGRRLNQSLKKKFAAKFDGVFLDESHNLSNKNTVMYRLCNAVAQHCDFRVATTGTPIGDKPEDYFAQFLIIDDGETLGDTLDFFRNCFYTKKLNKKFYYNEWTFDKSKKKLLNKIIRNRSIYYEDAEVHDLPPRVDKKVPIAMSAEAMEYYAMVRAGIIKNNDDYHKIRMGYLRMCQIASGYLSWEDPENPDIKVAVEFENNKIEWLRTFLPKVLSKQGRKVAIFHHFIPSGRRIEKLLDELGIQYASLRGEIKDKAAQKKRFKTDPKCRVLVGNDKAASTALNLQMANVGVLYELPRGLKKFKQLLKRLHRTGQTKRVFMYYLLAMGTVEEKQYVNLKKGRDLFDQVVKGNIKDI